MAVPVKDKIVIISQGVLLLNEKTQMVLGKRSLVVR